MLTKLNSKRKIASLAMEDLDDGFRKIKDSLNDEIEENFKFLLATYKEKKIQRQSNRDARKIEAAKMLI